MRSGRTAGTTAGSKWDPGQIGGNANGYSSSDDDEMTRLKPTPGNGSGTNTSAGSSSGHGGHQHSRPARSTNYRSHHSNSEGATSPGNESDNTYAEASLLQQTTTTSRGAADQHQIQQQRPIRYDHGYDSSEIYANDQLVSAAKYQQNSPPTMPGSHNSRYIGTAKQPQQPLSGPEANSPFINRTTSRNGGRASNMMEMPPPLPVANAVAALPGRPRQMTLAEGPGGQARGWDNGIGGYQTHTMLEHTRIAAQGNGSQEDYVKLGNFTMMGDRRNRQAFGAKTTSLHRRSLSDDSLKPSHPSSPGGSGGGQYIPAQGQPDPIVMPGFPVRTLQAHPPPPYSPSREKFLLTKRCRFHCSWKLVALSLTVLTLILSSVIAYFGAVKFPGTSSPPHHPVRSQSDSAVISAASSAASNGLVCPPALMEQPQAAVIPQGYTPSDYISTYATSQATPSLTNRRRWGQKTTSSVNSGQWYTASIEPLEMWLSQMHVAQPNTYFQMNLTIVNGGRVSSIAVYGRREAPPTVTNYDWVHIVAKDGRVIEKRSLSSSTGGISIGKELNHRGDWYFGVLNDNEDLITVRSVMDQKRNGGKPCPANCNGQGQCQDGVCQCYPQYSGLDCSQSICPLLCSGHGVYGGGECHCTDGWKGSECDVRASECLAADCSAHGQCREGVCICNPGWTGEHCQTRDCMDRTCNGRGSCQDATCVCDIGWMGPNCERRNEALYQCLPDCSGHGVFNVDLGKCECHSKWTGRDCNISLLAMKKKRTN